MSPKPEEVKTSADAALRNAAADAEKKAAQVRIRNAQKLRLQYMLELNALGLHENAQIGFYPSGVVPELKIIEVDKTQAARIRKQLETELQQLSVPENFILANPDLVDMSGQPLS